MNTTILKLNLVAKSEVIIKTYAGIFLNVLSYASLEGSEE